MTIHVTSSVSSQRAIVSLKGIGAAAFEVKGAEFSATNQNFALLAALPVALRTRRNLHIAGAVDRELLNNAQLLSHYWAQWKPDVYGPVEVTADHVFDDERSGSGEIICLSGGADSTYAYLRTIHEPRPELQRTIALGVFVQGFDYSLAEDAGYKTTLAKIRAVAICPVAEVRTDWKTKFTPTSWEHFHPLGLAAIQHLFSGQVTGGIIASDYTFKEDHAVAPWGSNTTTNRLLSSRGFRVSPVGETTTRLEKIEAIGKWGRLQYLNVCWQGARTGENCSRCEKCLRTMLMCEALEIDPVPAFGRSPTAEEIRNIPIPTPAKRAFIQQTVNAFRNESKQDLKRAAIAALSLYKPEPA